MNFDTVGERPKIFLCRGFSTNPDYHYPRPYEILVFDLAKEHNTTYYVDDGARLRYSDKRMTGNQRWFKRAKDALSFMNQTIDDNIYRLQVSDGVIQRVRETGQNVLYELCFTGERLSLTSFQIISKGKDNWKVERAGRNVFKNYLINMDGTAFFWKWYSEDLGEIKVKANLFALNRERFILKRHEAIQQQMKEYL